MKSRANIVIGVVLAAVVAAALGIIAWQQVGTDRESLRAVVHDSDGQVHELALSADTELVVQTDKGTNTVVVKDHSVYVREADCANQDCVHQGSIHSPGRQIICLPHEMWIEVCAAGDEGGTMSEAAVGEGDLDVVSR